MVDYICEITYFQSCTFSNYLFTHLNILMISSIEWFDRGEPQAQAHTHARARGCIASITQAYTYAHERTSKRMIEQASAHTHTHIHSYIFYKHAHLRWNCPLKRVNCIYQNQLFKEVHFKIFKWGSILIISKCRICN